MYSFSVFLIAYLRLPLSKLELKNTNDPEFGTYKLY